MEDEEYTKPLNNPVITLIIAGTACLFGVIALIVGITANSKASALEKKIAGYEEVIASAASSVGKLKGIDKRVNGIDKANDSFSLKVAEIDKNMRMLATGVESAINNVKGEIAATRKMMGGSSRGAPRKASATKPETTSSRGATAGSVAAKGQYKIQSGDTFNKVARQLGINLNDLINVNPDVDPRYLKIGQIINLPN